jgi:hypothetical protein
VSKRTPAAPASDIVLSRAQVDALAAVFQRKWQRPPTPVERAHLLEGLVREEILYREGVALGLDRDDALIRRRVGQKVELLAEEAQLPRGSEDGELQAYLEAHRARYEIEPRLTFEQVPLAPGASRQPGSRRVSSDPTPLPPRMDAAPSPPSPASSARASPSRCRTDRAESGTVRCRRRSGRIAFS